ncbi:MAG: hypothetical protein CTY15_06800 [Methylocystis sp.]|nr:MAG: hypothetical protein CTY15_06800 [Methylocystis sp.]
MRAGAFQCGKPAPGKPTQCRAGGTPSGIATMRYFGISFSALLALCATAKAEQTPAAQTIGNASAVEKLVEGLAGERNMRLKVGDSIFFNELLSTGAESRGHFVFDDRATLQMGPQSQVRLDNFVYANGAANAPGVAFNVARGVFRFVSAGATHKPYEVRTRNASVGVRGTAFAVRSTEYRTDAVLYDGAIEVCLPNGGACRTLDKPCTTLAVTDEGFTETRAVGARDWTFDEACRPKPAPGQRRRHGAAEPPPSAPPPVVAPSRVRAAPERIAPPPKVRAARIDPPRMDVVRPRPPRDRLVVVEPIRPRWPRRPHRPDYDEPDTDYEPDEPVRRFPVRPPVFFGGGIFRPHFPGGVWGGHYPRPQGPWGGGGPRPGGYGGMAQRWGRF